MTLLNFPRSGYQWMLFVDGENLTLCGQRLAVAKGVLLKEGPHYLKDVHLWLPNTKGFLPFKSGRINLATHSLRSAYYTSVKGDEPRQAAVRKDLWDAGFEPFVHKRRDGKSKAVDIRLTTDILSNAYLDNYDVCVLATGDGDYVPVVDAVKRRGKLVLLWFFKEEGLSSLRLDAAVQENGPEIREVVTRQQKVGVEDLRRSSTRTQPLGRGVVRWDQGPAVLMCLGRD